MSTEAIFRVESFDNWICPTVKEKREPDPQRAHRKKIPVTQYTLDGEKVKDWPSATDAGEAMKVSGTLITSVAKGRNDSAAGFKWKYTKTDDEQ